MLHNTRSLALSCALACLWATSSWAQSSAPAAPSWVMDIAPGTWAAVGGNTLSDVDARYDSAANPNYPNAAPWSGSTGITSLIEAWCGGALATRYGTKGGLIAHGGGHKNYYGNEVYVFDLATRMWKRESNPWKGPFNWDTGYSTGSFSDGSPTATHTYDFLDYHPASNSFVRLRADRNNQGGYNVAVAHLFSFDTKRWTRSPVNSQSHAAPGGWSAYDSKRDVFWVEGGESSTVLAKYDPNVTNGDGTRGSWSNYNRKVGSMYSVGAYDPVHYVITVADFREAGAVWGIDPANPGSSVTRLSEAGSGPSKDSSSGWEWSDIRKAFVYWRRGADVYEFKLTGSSWKSGPWTWSRITGSGNSVVPQANSSEYGVGDYSRFRVMRYADAEIAMVVTRINGPVYVFRMPGSQNLVVPNAPTDVSAN
jgi:hypothetical protein